MPAIKKLSHRSLIYKIARITGISTAIAHSILWYIFAIANPYTGFTSTDTALITFVFIVLPASLFALSLWFNRVSLMIIALLWSLPLSLYFLAVEGIFQWFGIVSLFYLFTIALIVLSRYKK